MSSALASYGAGKANAAATANAAAQQAYAQQLSAYAGGPRKEVLPYLDQNLIDMNTAYQNRGGFIGGATGNDLYTQALQQAGMPSSTVGTLGNIQNQMAAYYGQGGGQLTPEQVSAGANSLLNTDLINSQVDAYSRDIARNLGENQITGIRANDIASGNLGSSRGGVQEAIARRSAEDRIADFRGGLTGQALQQSQGLLQGNIQNQMGQYQAQAGLAQTLGGAEQQQMANLIQAGQLQQGLTQADIDNQIAQRDWDVTNQAQLGSLLQQYAQVGNLVDKPVQPTFQQGGKGDTVPDWLKGSAGANILTAMTNMTQ